MRNENKVTEMEGRFLCFRNEVEKMIHEFFLMLQIMNKITHLSGLHRYDFRGLKKLQIKLLNSCG